MSSLISHILVSEMAQDPWPEDAAIYQTLPDEQMLLPDCANVLAVKTLLKMNGLPFLVESRVNAAEMSPSGRVPFIKVGPVIVAEFEPILNFIITKGFKLHPDKSDSESGEMAAYMDSVQRYLVNAELFISWCDPFVYDTVTRERFGCMYPWLLSAVLPPMMRQEIKAKLSAIGWTKKTITEVYSEVNTCCEVLSERLADQIYFFGDQPTELDALVFGHLYAMLEKSPRRCDLPHVIKPYTNLVVFCQRIIDKYWPHHAL